MHFELVNVYIIQFYVEMWRNTKLNFEVLEQANGTYSAEWPKLWRCLDAFLCETRIVKVVHDILHPAFFQIAIFM